MSNETAPLPTLFSTVYQAPCVPLGQNNVDTDQIIPARFLKGIAKTGLGQALFADWRIPPETGLPSPDFVLNQPQYQGAGILIAGHNFGCGSSREHAPWALKDYGFQVILAISFADIFRNNALKNGLLPIALPEDVILDLLERVKAYPKARVSIHLATQQIDLPLNPDGAPMQLHFELDPYRKTCLLQGLDDIGYTLQHLPEIEAYEKQDAS